MTRVLVTGASGFIGRELVIALSDAGFDVRAAHRAAPTGARRLDVVTVGDLSAATDWSSALGGVDAVVHCAGPAHAKFSKAELDAQITQASAALAAQSAAAGVHRFIYLSSIKAVADSADVPVSEESKPAPADSYGRAKLAAEATVLAYPARSPEADAKANFARLMQLVSSGAPLPFANISNQRSLLSRASLAAAVVTILANAARASGVFHLADRLALSTPEIVAALAEGMGKRPRLFSLPHALLPRALTTSLAIDDTRLRAAYGEAWSRDARAAMIQCGAAYKMRAR